MKFWLFSIGIGILAGFLDILPMVFKKMDKTAIVSAFLQYFFVSIVILHIDLPGIIWWLEGGLISLCLATPILALVAKGESKSVPIIAGNAVVLGTLIGFVGHLIQL